MIKLLVWLQLSVLAGVSLAADSISIIGCTADGQCRPVQETEVHTGGNADLQFLWVWSHELPPRRTTAREIDATLRQSAAVLSSLQLQMPRTAKGDGCRVTAAPIEMWREVPEPLLPAFRCGETVIVPVTGSDDWRVRAASADETSLWQEFRAGRQKLVLSKASSKTIAIADSTGKAIPFAYVSLFRAASGLERSEIIARYEADEKGRVLVPNAADAGAVLGLLVSEPRHAPAYSQATYDRLPERITLKQGSALWGRVEKGNGNRRSAIAEAKVRYEGWIGESPALFQRDVITDRNGTYRFECLPVGQGVMVVTRDGFADVRKTIELPNEAMPLLVQLEPERLTKIRIVDDQGQPVTGAQIKAAGRITEADSKGNAKLRGISASEASSLLVTAPRMLPLEFRISPPIAEPAIIVLQRGVTVLGMCIERSGTPIASGKVRAAFGHTDRTVEIGADGHFELTLPPDRAARISVITAQAPDLSLSIRPAKAGALIDLGTIEIRPGSAIRGRVVAGGVPVPLAHVWAVRPSPEGEMTAWVRSDIVATTTDEQGRFEIKGLASEAVTLRADASGFCRAYSDVATDPDGGTIDIGDVALERGGTVAVARASQEGDIAEIHLREDLPQDRIRAEFMDGVAILDHVPPGSHRVVVRNGREIRCETRVDVKNDATSEVPCREEHVKVTGRAVAGGTAVPGGTILWSRSYGSPQPAMIVNRYSPQGAHQQDSYGGPSSQIVAALDSDGSFTCDLTAGSWIAVWLSRDGGSSKGVEIQVPDADEFHCTLSFPAGRVEGLARKNDGVTAADAIVREVSSGLTTRADAAGHFVFSAVPLGVVTLRAESGDLVSDPKQVTIAEDHTDPAFVELILNRADEKSITISVYGRDERPVPGAFVFVDSGAARAILTTDSDGAVDFSIRDDLPPAIRFAAVADGRWSFGDWIPSEQAAKGVAIHVGATGAMKLEGARPDQAIRIVSANGWDLSSMFRSLGSPILSGANERSIDGLPAGSYVVYIADRGFSVFVEADRAAVLRLDP